MFTTLMRKSSTYLPRYLKILYNVIARRFCKCKKNVSSKVKLLHNWQSHLSSVRLCERQNQPRIIRLVHYPKSYIKRGHNKTNLESDLEKNKTLRKTSWHLQLSLFREVIKNVFKKLMGYYPEYFKKPPKILREFLELRKSSKNPIDYCETTQEFPSRTFSFVSFSLGKL